MCNGTVWRYSEILQGKNSETAPRHKLGFFIAMQKAIQYIGKNKKVEVNKWHSP